jgi:hypothetical protein
VLGSVLVIVPKVPEVFPVRPVPVSVSEVVPVPVPMSVPSPISHVCSLPVLASKVHQIINCIKCNDYILELPKV